MALATAIALAALAPAAALEFEKVSQEDGVATDRVFSLHEDRQGLLWLGTMYGLVRFDGNEYRSFRHDPTDPASLSNDDIVTIAEDASGDLWLGTFGGGVNRYDRAAGRFDRFDELTSGIVWDLSIDEDGSVWVATARGLDRLAPSGERIGSWSHDPDDSAGLAAVPVRAVHADEHGVWVGTEGGGLGRLDRDTGELETWRHDPDDPSSLVHDTITSIDEGPQGRLWASSSGGGISAFEPAGEHFVNYRSDPEDPTTLLTDHVNVVATDGDVAWIGTGRGLCRFENGVFERFTHDASDPTSLHGYNVVAVLPDRSGVVWVSSYANALDRIVPGGRRFAHHGRDFDGPHGPAHRAVQSLREDRHGTLWIGTAGGLVAREGAGGPWREYRADPRSPEALGARFVQAILEDREGTLWFGHARGLSRYDREPDTFRTWVHDPEDETSLSGPWVTSLVQDHDGVVWVGTSNGVNAFDPATGRAVRLLHDPDDPSSLPENTVLSLHEDREGRLWVGTYAGIGRLDAARERFERLRQDPEDPRSLSNGYVYSFHEADDGTLWLGTGGGLNRLRADGGFDHFGERHGLPNAVIGSILPDDAGGLWLGTHRGLVRFDPADESVVTYDRADGLSSLSFRIGAAGHLADGTLVFGSSDGYHAFDPASFERHDRVPPVVLTAFRGVAPAVAPAVDLTTRSQIDLGWRDAFFSFEFAALDFRRPGKHRYAYRLEGVDADWIDAGTSNVATYTNVPPGDYTFRVRGSNGDGVWNDEGASIVVSIAPPFWRTNWFYALAVAAALLAAWTWHRLRVRARLRRFQEIEEARLEERERVRRKAADDFHDELGHRLTKIGLFSEMAKRSGSASTKVDDYLERIVTESHRLSDETRDFIWTLGRGGDSLFELADHLREFGEELFDRTDVTFAAEGVGEELRAVRLTMDSRRHITSIFKEGMNNALRHARCTHVTLQVKSDGREFEITLEDDGRGFDEPANGRGHGLKNMKLRARKIDGTIRFASRPGSGSRVTLTRRA
jgi:ligand-binding sensor domain-containing protein/signal transduction histidine kinase